MDLVAEPESVDRDPHGWAAERRAISRLMHDQIAHSILVVQSNLELFELLHETREPEARKPERKFLSEAKWAARKALEEVRGLASSLRAHPDASHDATWIGPRADLRSDADLRNELFFVLREAIRNALLHAHARRVVVDIRQSPGQITAIVEDDGDGFEQERLQPLQCVGLTSMSERTALVGGRLDIDSAPSRGTRVNIQMPYQGATGDRQ